MTSVITALRLALGLTKCSPDALHLCRAAPRQLGGLADAVARLAQRDHLGMDLLIGTPATVLALGLGQLDTLSLPFTPVLIVITGHLQGQPQQEALHGLQHDLGHAIGLLGDV